VKETKYIKIMGRKNTKVGKSFSTINLAQIDVILKNPNIPKIIKIVITK
jgi:hypothetical protein